jgi:hypothetical protein
MAEKPYSEWSLEELEARRDKISEEQAELTFEHRNLGVFINLKNIDIAAVKAEHARLGNVIEASEKALEANDG